jgi:hypothetical protein
MFFFITISYSTPLSSLTFFLETLWTLTVYGLYLLDLGRVGNSDASDGLGLCLSDLDPNGLFAKGKAVSG